MSALIRFIASFVARMVRLEYRGHMTLLFCFSLHMQEIVYGITWEYDRNSTVIVLFLFTTYV